MKHKRISSHLSGSTEAQLKTNQKNKIKTYNDGRNELQSGLVNRKRTVTINLAYELTSPLLIE